MKLTYRLNTDGYIDAIGYGLILPYEIDKTTPFQTIEDSKFWKQVNGEWIEFNPEWPNDKYNVKVSIPADIIVMNDTYLQLKDWVLSLAENGRALYYSTNGIFIMYFIDLLKEHEELLKQDINVVIEKK